MATNRQAIVPGFLLTVYVNETGTRDTIAATVYIDETVSQAATQIPPFSFSRSAGVIRQVRSIGF